MKDADVKLFATKIDAYLQSNGRSRMPAKRLRWEIETYVQRANGFPPSRPEARRIAARLEEKWEVTK